jgi:hypothetical protein
MVVNLSDFKNDFVKKKVNEKVSWQQYYYIVNYILKNIVDDLFSGRSFNIPLGLGSVRILKYKNNAKYIDWENTKKYGKYIYFNNFHSDGYRYRVFWDKSVSKIFKNKLMYGFKLSREHNRALAKGIKDNKYEFLS